MAKPTPARQPLMARCVQISPLASNSQPAESTALGAGRMRVDSSPKTTAPCQATSSATGSAQGARRKASCRVDMKLICPPVGLSCMSAFP